MFQIFRKLPKGAPLSASLRPQLRAVERLRRRPIPLPARIVSIVDYFDALTHDRPYRPAWPRAIVCTAVWLRNASTPAS